jgi:membrane-associated protein
MNFLVQIILPYILLYKYYALFAVTFLASSILPIPAGTLLVVSAAFASQGYFKIYTLLIVIILANIIGDNVSYWIARLYAKKFFYKIGFLKKILTSTNFLSIEKGISRHPGLFVVISRFEVVSTLTINLICGMSKTSYKKFVMFEVIGTFANVLFYSSVGYFFSASWQVVNKLIGGFTVLFFFIIVLMISVFWKKVLNKLNKIN